MKKLRKVFGSVTSLGSGGGEDHGQRRSSSHQSLAGTSGTHLGGSPQRGSNTSYDSQSLTSHVSSVSAGGELDPFSKNDRLFTKLHKWAYLGDVEKLKKFIKKVNVDSRDSSGKSPLHYAAAQGHTEAILFLLGSKANANVQDKAGVTPLFCAVEKGQISVVQMFLQRKVDYRIPDNQGNGVLHVAARTAASELLDLLLDCGCDSDEINKLGRTPLHVAAMEGQEEALESLLRCGASVNAADREGVTPLMMCAKLGNPLMVELLLEHGADHSLRDSSTWTAGDYARFTNHNGLFEKLKSLQTEGESLFATRLVDVGTDETSNDEEFAEPKKKKQSGANSSSWSDDSDLDSVDAKPKFNISKFLPSSDESTDIKAASASGLQGSSSSKGESGPPKPPRLHSSASSVSIPENVTQEEEEMMKQNSPLHKDVSHKEDMDPWNSSSSEEKDPKLKFSELGYEFKLSARGDDPDKIYGDTDRKKVTDRAEAEMSGILRRNPSLDVSMENIRFHSSEEDVSFGDDESEMLPDVHIPKKIVLSHEDSQELSEDEGQHESRRKSVEEMASLPSQAPSPQRNLQSHFSQQSIKKHGKEISVVNPEISGTEKEHFSLELDHPVSSRKASSRLSHQRKDSWIFDSCSEDDVEHLPLQKPRRKRRPASSPGSPQKVADGKEGVQAGSSNPDLPRSLLTHTIYEDNTNLPHSANAGAIPKVRSGHGASNDHKILYGQQSDTSVGSGDKVKTAVDSKSSSLSTVVGTLGREGTLQEREEVWEANASISPRHEVADSEEEEEEKKVEDADKVKQRDEVDMRHQDITPIQQQGTCYQDTVEGMAEDTTHVKRTRKMTSSEMRAAEVKVDVKSIRDKLSSSIEESLSPRLGLSFTPCSMVETERKDRTKNMVKEKSVDNELVDTGKPLGEVSPMQARETTPLSVKVITPVLTKEESPPRFTSASKVVESKNKLPGFESCVGSIVFSDEELSSQDHIQTHRSFPDEGDDVFSVASTETEESTHINSSIKDCLLAPLASLSDNLQMSQLQDIVRELRLKLEKELGRRVALETKVSQMRQTEKHIRTHVEQLEKQEQRRLQEISSLTSRIKQYEYQSSKAQDEAKLHKQNHKDNLRELKQLEEMYDGMKMHSQQQEQLVDSLMAQLQTKEKVNQGLQERLQLFSNENKYVSMKGTQTDDMVESKKMVHAEVQVDKMDSVPAVSICVQTDEKEVELGTSDKTLLKESKDLRVSTLTQTENESYGTKLEHVPSIEEGGIPKSVSTSVQTVNLICKDMSVGPDSSYINTVSEASETHKLKEWDATHPKASVIERSSESALNCKYTQTDEIDRPETECRSTECEIKAQVISVGIQSEFTQKSTSAQTDTTLLNSEMYLKKLKKTVATLCCPSYIETASQTDPHIVTPEENIRPSHSREEKLPFDDLSCIRTMLNDYQKEIKLLISEWEQHTQTSDMVKCLSNEISMQILNLKDNLESHLSDISSSQHNLAVKKVNSEVADLKNELMDQLRKLRTEMCSSSSVEVSVSHIEEIVHRDLMKIQKELGSISHQQESAIIPKLQQSEQSHKNQYLLADVQRNIEEISELQNKIVDKVNGNLGKQLQETLTLVKDFSAKSDDNVFEKPMKDMALTLKNLEDVIEKEFKGARKASDFDWDQKVQDLTDTLSKKISDIPSQIHRPDENSSVLADLMEQHVQDVKESNRQLAQMFKAKDSSKTAEVNEAMEENFQILQDQITRLNQNLVHKMNEVAHQGHLFDDQRLQNHHLQITEVSNQLSKLQNHLIKIQTSLETVNSLPGTSTLDNSLLAVVRSSNEQVVTSLQHQSSSVVQLLETLQREVKNLSLSLEKKQESREVHSLLAVIAEKDRELKRLVAEKEEIQEKITSLNVKQHDTRLVEQEAKMKIKSLEETIHTLKSTLRDNEQRIQLEVMKASNLAEQLTTLRNENFRITADKEKISTQLTSELQRTQWLEEQYQELKSAKINLESKFQEQIISTHVHQNSLMQRTPPSGRDRTSLEDDCISSRADIQRLESQKETLENQLHEKEQENKKIEIKLHEVEASLSLERNLKEELEKELVKIKDDLAMKRNYATEKFKLESSLHQLKEHNKELELEIEAKQDFIGHLKKKLEMLQDEKVKTREEMMKLKECKYNNDLLSQERDLGKAMQEKTEKELQDLRLKVAREYIPRSSVNQIEKEIESRYQLDFSTKVLELHHQAEEKQRRQDRASMALESQEQSWKSNIAKLSQENVRLKNKLAVQEEEQDTWKLRHDKLLEIYLKETENSSRKENRTQRYSKPSAFDTKVDFKGIDEQLNRPFMTSSFLGQITTPPDLNFSQTSVSAIDSYTHTYSNALDETIKKHLFDLKEKPQWKKPEVRDIKRNDKSLDESCSEYVNIMQKKYGL